MLDRQQPNGLQVSKPKEPPSMGEVDWNAWWVAIDKRIEEHLVNEREVFVDAAAYAIADLRKEIAENDHLRGPPGRPGADAKLPRVKIWREDNVYYEGDCVAFGGSLYQAQCDTGKSPLFAKHWLCVATLNVSRKLSAVTNWFAVDASEYCALDAVLVDGTSYLAIVDDPGLCPMGKGWQLLAAAGSDGATGPRGERGERGLIGPRGEPAPTITGWRVDRASYTVVPVLSNGIEGAPLELRGLFEQFFNEVASPSRA